MRIFKPISVSFLLCIPFSPSSFVPLCKSNLYSISCALMCCSASSRCGSTSTCTPRHWSLSIDTAGMSFSSVTPHGIVTSFTDPMPILMSFITQSLCQSDMFSAPRESVECADTVLMSYWYFGEQWAEGTIYVIPMGGICLHILDPRTTILSLFTHSLCHTKPICCYLFLGS